MRVQELLAILPSVKTGDSSSAEVSGLVFDSRKIEPGCVFVAIRGGKADGHAFLGEAEAKRAAAIVVEDASRVPSTFRGHVAVVQDSREALNRLAARYFGEPAKNLFCVGVTGTNGKTTTTYMIEAIFEAGGIPAGVIGTIDHHFRGNVWKTEMTTPDPLAFQERLSQFVQHGAKAVALEVTSHALRQARVDEVPFDVAIFTNLTRDHLDYHSGMDDYFDAKTKLFRDLLPRSSKPVKTAVINGDDEYGKRLVQETRGAKIWKYGKGPDNELRFGVLGSGFGGTRFRLKTPMGSKEFHLRLVGEHMVSNACAAVGAGLAAGIPLSVCRNALNELNGVKGRLEAVSNKKGIHVFVDYAHTDDALATVLFHLNGIRKSSGANGRIITVFGCGGDRDRGKRPLMMKAALERSDLVVLTSDNPRTEDPERILNDAEAAAPSSEKSRIYREVDRKKGIAKALELADPGDVVLIAGKGHEDYQIVGTTRHPFSDFDVVREILG